MNTCPFNEFRAFIIALTVLLHRRSACHLEFWDNYRISDGVNAVYAVMNVQISGCGCV